MRPIDADELKELRYGVIQGIIKFDGNEYDLIDKCPTLNVVVVPDCNKCAYDGDIARWEFCEHCIGNTYGTNNFLSKSDILK